MTPRSTAWVTVAPFIVHMATSPVAVLSPNDIATAVCADRCPIHRHIAYVYSLTEDDTAIYRRHAETSSLGYSSHS